MKRQLFHMLGVMSIACALLAGPAYADEASAADGNATVSNTASQTAGEGDSAANLEQKAPLNLIDAISQVTVPILSIDKDALFQRQYDWVAVENENFDSANEDGSLSEWQTDWFISHDWSDYGAVIAALEPGDAVTVNGKTVLIEGRMEWPNDGLNWDVYNEVGWDKVVFQTCLGDYAIWIAYGVYVNPTPEFLAEHQPQSS